MICYACGSEFEVGKGHGGQNRLLCFSCLPFGLDKKTRVDLQCKINFKAAKIEKLSLGFDDADTLRQKLRLGRQLGVAAAFFQWPEVSDIADSLFRRG